MLRYAKILVALLLVVSVSVNADSVSLYSNGDAHVWQYDPNSNCGSSTNLTVGYVNGWSNTLIGFDLSPLYGATVNSAVLWTYVWNSQGAFPTSQIYIARNTSDWDQSTVTWNNKPGYSGAIPITAPSILDWWSVDVTSFVQDFVSESHPNYGFQIYKGNALDDSFYLRSSEHASNYPVLIINYTPMHLENTTFGAIKAMFR